jgi:four helix bundle protein
MALDHTKLTVYRESLALLCVIDEILGGLPPGSGRLRDQLDDAATSIVANIAEGAGELSPNEKKRFYRKARRSVNEVAAWIDILSQRRQIEPELAARADALVTSIASMLGALVR